MRGGVWLYERGREQRRRDDQCQQTGRRHMAVGRENVVGAISKLPSRPVDFPPFPKSGKPGFSQRPPAARPGRLHAARVEGFRKLKAQYQGTVREV